MKQIIIAMIWLLPAIAHAQDVITTTEGGSIQGRVFKITPKAIKYKNTGAADSTVVHSIPKKEVFQINYETGVKETFNQEKYVDDNDPDGHWDRRSMTLQGREDAQEFYDGYRAGKWWTYGVTVATTGIVGLIPAIIITSTPPRNRNLNYPDEELMKNPRYSKAYKQEARRIKSRKVWGGYGLGVLTDFVLFGGVIIL